MDRQHGQKQTKFRIEFQVGGDGMTVPAKLSSNNECDNIWKANLTIKLMEYLAGGDWDVWYRGKSRRPKQSLRDEPFEM